jgi:hypothetical protein
LVMAYLNLFKILLYLLLKKSYSSFPAATLFLSRDTFFGADSTTVFHYIAHVY